jgi:transcriptional regulator with XRE-family HTH domain
MNKVVDIPTALRTLQARQRWTQTRLAFALGLRKGRMSEILNGNRSLPYHAACRAYELGVSAAILLASRNQPKRDSRGSRRKNRRRDDTADAW